MGELGFPRLLQPSRGVCRGMAGAGGRPAAAGFCDPPRDSRRGAPRVDRGMHAGRRFLAPLAALLLVGAAQAEVLSARIWPARDYTRLTIESKQEIQYTLFTLKDPERVVLELEVD